MSQQKWPAPLDDPAALALRGGWSEEVYVDLLGLKDGSLARADFDAKYQVTRAILVLDVTGFTVTAMRGGDLNGFLRIVDVHRLTFPMLEAAGARAVHAFADDVVAIFDECGPALDAALALHARIAEWGAASNEAATRPEACIGLGFGDVYEIGPNLAMGDEMNRASKLGEDIARGGETLVTEGVTAALSTRADLRFEEVTGDDPLFPYYRASSA